MQDNESHALDAFTEDLFRELYAPGPAPRPAAAPDSTLRDTVMGLKMLAEQGGLLGPMVKLFTELLRIREKHGFTPAQFGIARDDLLDLARRHAETDEHGVTIGGRARRAVSILREAAPRMEEYLARHAVEAPSGIEIWPEILENQQRIKKALNISEREWNSYPGQIGHAIESVETLSKVVDLPREVLADVKRAAQSSRMRLTPYYASLIRVDRINDPILLQSVPTGEMVDNTGVEIPPVASDHSPARLIDQFIPRVLAVKATNMCAMYCTHCLRLAHIGSRDRVYSREAYGEALAYIREHPSIRDLLVTGGDAFVLPNSMLKWLLEELDRIEHVQVKRLGTRIPVTTPQRIDAELLDILEASNERKPLRVVTQINTAQEITPASRAGFYALSRRVMAVMNQAVLLKGVNDSRIKMWKLCEAAQSAYVRPYYVFNCSHRNPQFKHLRVPVRAGQDIVESMYGNLSGDLIPRYIALADGKVPLHRTNILESTEGGLRLRKPWDGKTVLYPDADPQEYARENFAFAAFPGLEAGQG